MNDTAAPADAGKDDPALPAQPAAGGADDCASLGASALPFVVVGIGASAGGVETLRSFFSAVPAGAGMAFVVVMHLDPRLPSQLAALLQAVSVLPVEQATDGMPIVSDRVYVSPPADGLTIEGGRLRIAPPDAARRSRGRSIDRFLVSLAREQKERAIGVVLTGLDGDGADGLVRIKAEGGMAMVQEPASAAHPSMPNHALATGQVDWILPVAEMPAALAAYVANARLSAAGPANDALHAAEVDLLQEVLTLLRLRSSIDFRGYKKPMLVRRVHRRMGLCNIRQMSKYVQHLREHPDEAKALAGDFMIGVTAFFRELDAWTALESEVLPALVERKADDQPLRAWVPACSSGEEAYSVAMLLLEQVERLGRAMRIQVFATDLDVRALEHARRGVYPESIDATVAPDRLQRWFTRVDRGWQVRKALREVVVLAPQNLLADPPFSRLDLISCRNLLIYRESESQRRLLRVFHFALEPGGVLMLGKSENVSQQRALFEPVGPPAHRVFRATGETRTRAIDFDVPSKPSGGAIERRARSDPGAAHESNVGEMVRQAVLELHSPPAVLVDREYRALYFHGRLDAYLAPPRGEATQDLLALVRESLRPRLRAVLHAALHEGRRGEAAVSVGADDGVAGVVTVTASPLPAGTQGPLALLVFERAPLAPPAVDDGHDDRPVVLQLERELRSMRLELHTAIEELETANEELKVSNEEAMSMNEELQSTNEELETSKEELQSVNEELTTVNAQLEAKVGELESTNDDLGNLLTSSSIPTVFLDRQFRIKRYTPSASRLFSLIATDLDRPLTDIASRCDTAAILRDARHVLETLAPVQRELRADDDTDHLLRVLPYRTLDDRIDGVVLVFTDVSELRRAADGLRRLAALMRISSDAIVVHDLDGRILAWNRGAERMYGWSEAEALVMNVAALLPEDARGEHAQVLARVREGETVAARDMTRTTRDGRRIAVSATLSVLFDDAGAPMSVAAIERDVTERQQLERQLREREARFRSLADSAPAIVWTTEAAGRIDFVNRHFVESTGRSAEHLLGDRWQELVHPDDLPGLLHAIREAMRDRRRFEVRYRMRLVDGVHHWTTGVAVPRFADDGRLDGYVGLTLDVHRHHVVEEALRDADTRKDEFLAMLGHELRNPLVPLRNAVEVLRLVGGPDPRLAWTREMLARQTQHLTRLVDDLLDVSRISRG